MAADPELRAWLDAHINLERGIGVPASVARATAPTLDRMRGLLELLGSPQLDVPMIQLTGTNGKGSTARIVIDPLTPVLWSTKDLYEQRDLIGYMFKQTRKVGTVLCTLEEHGQADLAGPETVIPMYLADCVVHLRFNSNDADPSRLLKIVKCRNSRHSPAAHPFQIVRGLGIVVQGVDGARPVTVKTPSQLRQLLLTRSLPKNVRDSLDKSLDGLTDADFRGLKPDEILELILQEYQGA